MAKEIERKFLLKGDDYKHMAEGVLYRQAYLSTHAERTVRVRIAGEKAYITIKGKNFNGIRDEFEYEIPAEDAEQMLNDLCKKPIIEKYRYKVSFAGMIWEIDEFFGENQGLAVAEIELQSPEQEFLRPEWVGEEVTEDVRYLNSNLVKMPFSRWNAK